MELSPGLIALIGTIFGGAGLKIIESWLTRSKERKDDARELRDELRIQINVQNERIAELEKEADDWQSKYYDLRDVNRRIEGELQIALEKVREVRGQS